jgi:hypothetical protein
VKLDSQPIYGTITLCSFVGVIFMWMKYPPTGDANALAVLNTLTGALGVMAQQVISNSFGSSRESVQKNETIAKLAGAGVPGDASSSTTTTQTTTQAPPVAADTIPLPRVVPATTVSGKPPASVFGTIGESK